MPRIYYTAAEEERYEQRLWQLAAVALGPGWRDTWPDWDPGVLPSGVINKRRPYMTPRDSILSAEQEIFDRPAMRFVYYIILQ